MSFVTLNGELVPGERAHVSVRDRGFTHGLGLYETLKLYEGVPVFFEEHLARLGRGLQEIGLAWPATRAQLAEHITLLARANDVQRGACRLLITAGPPEGEPTLLIQTERRDPPERPLRVITHLGVRVRAQLKAMTVMQSYLAQRAAAAAGADDALLVDEEGRIFEGATSNVFVVRGGGLVTPPAEGALLPGIMRAVVEQLAEASGIPVVEAYLRTADLRPQDSLLLTSSVRGIVLVQSVDDLELRADHTMLTALRSAVHAAELASAAAFRQLYGA